MAVSKNGDGKGRKRVSKEERRAEHAHSSSEKSFQEGIPFNFRVEVGFYKDWDHVRLRRLWEEHQRRLNDPRTCASCGARNVKTSIYWTGQMNTKACRTCVAEWEAGTRALPEPERGKWVSIVSHANGGGRKS